ncbi:D-glycero-alpha-D-manno-heptose-1,7-bisphosphate 7-phosphatase [Clostridium folliculivorans]|uniref:D,D-heptose 1,7-bisphosphate phosphatase n=1 Tax=Clostridium folliculivorans TaxID=2886038 RepID=A0A9W5Y6H2_9CLOT|nr:HAD family hydrolase [Clostridium folliculivorans]GKU27282.1 D-glycero-alpha-D-manno-heptose-1,7-bisphosphate 7-phosphatase [Clostridium folliculivorans]
MNKAVILDRDGTINVEKNYLYKIEDFSYTYKANEAIKLLNDNNYKVIVITNQAGVARGYYKEDDVISLHNWINDDLRKINAHIDDFFYCPHHPDAGIDRYKIDCNCRKPNNQLYKKAIEKYNIDTEGSFVIGDKISDIKPGKELGLLTCLVDTGYGSSQIDEQDICDFRFKNLYEAVQEILKISR